MRVESSDDAEVVVSLAAADVSRLRSGRPLAFRVQRDGRWCGYALILEGHEAKLAGGDRPVTVPMVALHSFAGGQPQTLTPKDVPFSVSLVIAGKALTDGKQTRSEPPSPPPDRPEDDVEMGFFEHLAELRTRLVRAIYGIVPCVAVSWIFKEHLLQAMLDPLVAAYRSLGIEPEIHFKNLVDPFLAYLKISIIAGLLMASPWVFWQVWAFIAPGLYKREKLLAIPFVLMSTLCFAGGALFGYFIVFPMGFETFLSYAGELPSGDIAMQPTIMIDEYIRFSLRLLLAFGVVFEVPVVVTFISAIGMVTWRGLLAFARWWVLVATLLAAFLTPPDVASQLIMLVPLVLLYFVSIGIAFLIDLRRGKKAEQDPDYGKFER